MDLKEIQNLIKFVARSGTSEVKLETDDFKITIKTGSGDSVTNVIQQAAAPIQQAAAPQEAAPVQVQITAPVSEDSKYITVKSPIIGTFYRRPSPDKPLFAEVGQTISEGDVLCVIEAMKLFNEIESEISGKIVKILVDDATPVEFDQPLFLVDPS
ncbi:acetyl-CoA carboxylase biotin carboxyl carrier protein [Flavobacteriaceae bacterium]|nr:acetyl-CoA carboxylase biotin carboxyl carrier protein [Flavobacteriaceae bacterium]MDA9970315.1 acetyl-CoA carboxylase biotin carboxyl carrier protein [Flavobacteriaceae bacterium]MDB9873963.1 acetyl-CoA carboxylase biotin carboxyl carrier protein [Flavobacteriaceae bacterium]MDB9954786.1 acetyl-CoA carboxylase biotin carboxyl carrier protein [Flavobacteriaceae bacterium]MDC1265318.1 acetyl-CoA carboxylase biotin carboxyl carrier protein [Flavobacteriaceae bacterium]